MSIYDLRDQAESQGYGSTAGMQGASSATQAQSGMYGAGMPSAYTFPVQGADGQGPGGLQSYAYSQVPSGSYQGALPDMQHMMQVMMNIGNQLDLLNKQIAQNNQLLRSLHNQGDTKCVKGGGGGAVIVRM